MKPRARCASILSWSCGTNNPGETLRVLIPAQFERRKTQRQTRKGHGLEGRLLSNPCRGAPVRTGRLLRTHIFLPSTSCWLLTIYTRREAGRPALAAESFRSALAESDRS